MVFTGVGVTYSCPHLSHSGDSDSADGNGDGTDGDGDGGEEMMEVVWAEEVSKSCSHHGDYTMSLLAIHFWLPMDMQPMTQESALRGVIRTSVRGVELLGQTCRNDVWFMSGSDAREKSWGSGTMWRNERGRALA